MNPFIERLRREQRDCAEIIAILPEATEQMIRQFSLHKNVGITTVRIWASQGTIKVEDGRIVKVPPRLMTEQERQKIFEALQMLCGNGEASTTPSAETQAHSPAE